jgi:hypothetical protein
MIVLSELDMDAPLGSAPTILGLFNPRAPGEQAPAGLTDWDRSFLRSLYVTRLQGASQRVDIADLMLHDLAP